MSTKHATQAAEVLRLVGGAGNIRSLSHCQTRLRFDLKDPEAADIEGLQNADGVATTLQDGSGLQVVIGLDVQDVYDEVQALRNASGTSSEADQD